MSEAPTEVPLDEACILGHPKAVEREFGYACRRHYHWIDRTLRQIEELFALLDDVLIPGPGGDGRSGTRVGSPAPGRVEVMAITDKRVAGRKIPMTPYLNSDGRGGLESNGDDVPDLPGSLASWARMVVEERNATDELDGFVAESIRVLRRERLWIARQEWLDDYVNGYGGLVELHRAVARGVGTSMWPEPLGPCLNCDAPLYPTIGVDEVTCRKCKSSWEGPHYLRLRLIHEQQRERTAQS